jgi:Tol biopolymer transport system component
MFQTSPISQNFLRLGLIGLIAVLTNNITGISSTYAAEDLVLKEDAEALQFTVNEGSWVSVSLLPDGESFVFDLLGDIYRLDIAGNLAEPVTTGMGFDSQPVVSPNGEKIAFISDRDGKDNLWVANIDGSDPVKLSKETYATLISPTWSPDGQNIVVTKRTREIELVQYHVEGGTGVAIAQQDEGDEIKKPPGVGAVFSPDGNYLYFAERLGGPDTPIDNFPVTQIVRLDLNSGARIQVTRSEGGGVRPVVSPDGQWLVYGTRFETNTGLRIRNLDTGEDRWLTYPIQRDSQENFRPSSRGMLPGYAFTPNSEAIILSTDGQFQQIRLDDSSRSLIPFTANVNLEVGPDLTQPWRVDSDPFAATLVQDPDLSPDNESYVASVLTRLYSLEKGEDEPELLTPEDMWAFKPVYSPDGRWIAFVSWSANDGGHIWKIRSNGNGRPQQLTENAAFYTDIVWQQDGERIWGLRGNEWMRHQDYSEFSGLSIPLELVSVSEDGGEEAVVLEAGDARVPHFGPESDRIYLSEEGTLFSINLTGGDRRDHIKITGPKGIRFPENAPGAEELRISPDGNYVLAHVIKQVWLTQLPRAGATVPEVSVRSGSTPVVRLTDIGADYISWSDDGDTVMWALGSTVFERALESINFRSESDDDENDSDDSSSDDADSEDETSTPFTPLDEHESVAATKFAVLTEQNIPQGNLLLRGANLITMKGSSLEELSNVSLNQDLLISNNRITAIGQSGSLDIPEDTEIIDASGKWIIPGMIDTHAHWEFRTGDVLEPSNWSVAVNLAFGVTSGLDVQTANHDYFVYRDMQRSGQVIGQRAFMTGPGIFGRNDFQNYNAVHSYLRRYSDHYNTPNIKAYISGNREQRQWVVKAAQDLKLMPTTEGGGDQKLDLTHAIDGMHGNEHNLPDTPLFEDLVQLYSRTRTAYTPTLIVQYNAERMREYFFTRTEVHDNPKLLRFYPHNRLDELTRRRPGWIRDDEFRFQEGAAAAAAIQRAGGLLGVGGHAELQGQSFHWEMWAYALGGMSTTEILRAATIDAAHIIGAPSDLGSIETGKLADLVVLNSNPLDDIRNSVDIDRVVQNGRLYDGDTLDQQWPEQIPFPETWWQTDQETPPGV